jgi:hypothetical protein
LFAFLVHVFLPPPLTRELKLNCYPNYSCIATVFLPSVVSDVGLVWVCEILEQNFLNIYFCWLGFCLLEYVSVGLQIAYLKGLVSQMWWHHFWINKELCKDYTFHRVI